MTAEVPSGYRSHHVAVNGIDTHYLEAGDGPAVVLIHSGEFGASAELSWRYSIAALAQAFHVYAPDMIGFGQTEKLHHFTGASEFRIKHIRAFCEAMGIERAHFVGSSYGGSLLLRVASDDAPAWPIDRIVVVSGGGNVPVNEHRQVLLDYDGTRKHMRQILRVLFYAPEWWADEFVDDWHRSSMEPGAWECAAAARLAPPGVDRPWRPESPDPARVFHPTLVVAGENDFLREHGYASKLARELPHGRAHVFPRARHFPHIEHASAFNELALEHLSANGAAPDTMEIP
jgi:pimeloyl-ACP methyl ester carboxylesterase